MLDNYLTDYEDTWSNRDVVLEKEAENSTDVTCKQQESAKEKEKEKDTLKNRKIQLNFMGDTY